MKETLNARITRLEDEIIRAFNERDRLALITAQAHLREARDERDRLEFDANWSALKESLKHDPAFLGGHNLN